MSQHDLTIANQGFPAFRADLNDALQALGSCQSGTSAPSPTFANQLWYDTTNNILKIRNEDNDAWISVLTLDQTTDAVTAIGSLTLSDIVSLTGSQTLTNKTLTNPTINGFTGNTAVVNIGSGQIYKDTSGNVGIGTSSPSQKLQLESASDLTLQITKTGVASFGITNNGAAGAVLNVESVPMIFKTSNTERMRLTSSGALAFGGASNYGSSGQVLTSAGSGSVPVWATASGLSAGTAVSASGTSVDFTGIPSSAKRVTVILNAISTNGGSNLRFQVGSGSMSTSNYSGATIGVTSGQGTSGTNAQNGLSGLDTYVYSQNSSYAFFGTVVWTLVSSNTWTCVATIATSQSTSIGFFGGSSPALGGALDRIRLTTANGTDSFDAGTINIFYE